MRLVPPEVFQAYRTLSIDPGLNAAGVAIYDIINATGAIAKIEAHTLDNNRLIDHTGLDDELITERVIKLSKMKEAFIDFLSHINPAEVVCEAPFYNRLTPTAYAPLVEVVNNFHRAVLEFNPNITFTTLSPLTVKSKVGAKSIKNDTDKGKHEMRRAIMAIPEIMGTLKTPIELMSQHAVDAVAVGYAHILTRRSLDV